jgi:signal transduction histidine kinase/CheY-like chemotaxis protein
VKLRPALFAKYALPITLLSGAALLVSGAIEIYFSHRLHRAVLAETQHDKAQAAASIVSGYVEDLAQRISIGTGPVPAYESTTLEKRRIDLLRLLRTVSAITTMQLIDGDGRERLQVSRLEADRMNSAIDVSRDAAFIATRAGRTHFSPIYFFEHTEPYMTIGVPDPAGDGSVLLAEVNLKFIWNVVSDIRIGEQGYAYVVDARGGLVAHPDIHRVLQVSDFSGLSQVRAALTQRDRAGLGEDGLDFEGRPVMAAYAAIPPLGWFIFVEQPRSEALAPLYASLSRTALFLLIAMAIAVLASLALARRLVAPIRQLQAGAQKIGAGDLGHRIHVDTGDELEELSKQFNRMGAQLQHSYADLERRIAERTRDLQAANEAKSRFLAAASHDLRQPIHALALLAGQLDSCGSVSERKALSAEITRGIASLADLFDDLLDISRLEAGAVVAQNEDFAISAVLDAVSAQFGPLARQKGLHFTVRPSRAWVHSDPVLLQRILLNFVSNAVRYTDRGGVLVACRRRSGHLQIGVWDTGCGIPEESRQEIFREFVQLHSTDRDRGKGLGLGLAIVARLAPLIGSSIELRSTLARGSMFAIRVPAVAPTLTVDALPVHAHEHAPKYFMPFRGVFAVVVDDDAAALAGMQRALESWGCLVLTAYGAAEAVAMLSQHDRVPELIVCDYRLAAGENGVDAIRRIHAAVGTRVPSLLVTADRSPDVLRSAQAHRYRVLLKPVSPAKLRALVDQLLAQTERTTSQSL